MTFFLQSFHRWKWDWFDRIFTNCWFPKFLKYFVKFWWLYQRILSLRKMNNFLSFEKTISVNLSWDNRGFCIRSKLYTKRALLFLQCFFFSIRTTQNKQQQKSFLEGDFQAFPWNITIRVKPFWEYFSFRFKSFLSKRKSFFKNFRWEKIFVHQEFLFWRSKENILWNHIENKFRKLFNQKIFYFWIFFIILINFFKIFLFSFFSF